MFQVGDIVEIKCGEKAPISTKFDGALAIVVGIPGPTTVYYKVRIDKDWSYLPGREVAVYEREIVLVRNSYEYKGKSVKINNTTTVNYKQLIEQECDALKALLLEKNKSYGSSIFEPVRIFSKADTEEQILTRIDDKISRIQRGKEYQSEDTITDLVGYLLMLKIYRKINNK
jgi:hypothetical protein